jgi:hypothetical protein
MASDGAKSPFPGMDPYLETRWRDVHHSLITYAREALAESLPRDLRARIEERVAVEAASGTMRSIYPDVDVVERPSAEGSTAAADPLVLRIDDEIPTEGSIQIVEAGSGGRVVTVIEVISPTNRLPGPGQDLYRRKQRELLEGGVNLVEIDLLRSGGRVLVVPTHKLPPSHRTTYLVCVSRAARPGTVEVYRAPLRERLPVVRVPLRASDADVSLDLQALLARCYRAGAWDDIDYKRSPEPPLDPDDAAWADERLRGAGLR